MTIANPIYDIVFKYLLEDLDIAKGILSTILKVEITELAVQPQETVAESEQGNKSIRIYRIDFAAVVRQKDGSSKKILIELQKAKRNTTALRFRRYLAENYAKEETVVVNGVEKKRSLEIVTIYFLGFNLEHVPVPVLYGNHSFRDGDTGEVVEEALKEDFVRLLNHESYMIQIRRLPRETKTRLYKVLSVFNQSYKTANDHALEYKEEANDPLVEKMLNRLTRAMADEAMRKKMDIEDEFDREYQEMESKYGDIIEQKNQELEEKDYVIEQKEHVIEQNKQVIEQNKQVIEQKDQALEEKDKEIAELKKLLGNKG
jgi:hypothetical protein